MLIVVGSRHPSIRGAVCSVAGAFLRIVLGQPKLMLFNKGYYTFDPGVLRFILGQKLARGVRKVGIEC